MNKFYYTFLFVIGSLWSSAQIHSGNKFSVQTNLFALNRIHNAVNIAVLINEENAFWELGIDIGFRLDATNDDEMMLNYFTTEMGKLPSIDFIFGRRHAVPFNKNMYAGLQGQIGWFSFGHRQLACTEIESTPDLCRCISVEERAFITNHIRLGAMYRVGYVWNLKYRQAIDFWAQAGMFFYHRRGYDQYQEHVVCDDMEPNPAQKPIFLNFENMISNGLYDPKVSIIPMIQLGISYRFL